MDKLSNNFPVSRGLSQGCTLAPLMFKIYLEQAVTEWKHNAVKYLGILVGDETLYILLFADDQIIITADEDESLYMFRRLQEDYQKCGLKI